MTVWFKLCKIVFPVLTPQIVNGRICGDISVSRAFGDMRFKTKKYEYVLELSHSHFLNMCPVLYYNDHIRNQLPRTNNGWILTDGKDARKGGSGREMVSKVCFPVGSLTCLN